MVPGRTFRQASSAGLGETSFLRPARIEALFSGFVLQNASRKYANRRLNDELLDEEFIVEAIKRYDDDTGIH